ncbi:MAG: gliding motility-associated C-terminal domain-containing protein [Phaeodactylibacter sp.]|uniref:T9SS type B sorting domain-containing protein n=1 Tax=Phaeodactylibacter sp. TaxID=1940289 RepID=UPI0032EF0A70
MNKECKSSSKYRWLTLAFFLGHLTWAGAEVAPPEFLCVSNDTLRWELPDITCGPFNAYEVFGSQNIDGPYALLASVTDPAVDFYYHDAPGVGTWYYYLQTNADCPGEPVITSDTLDSLIPLPARIRSVSVENGSVLINWGSSPSPEVVGYIISREVPGVGSVVLDTVFAGNTYQDDDASPGAQQETYFIEAIDPCGNKSIVAPPHSTILLEAQDFDDPCIRNVTLAWTPYIGWNNGVAEYQIYEAGDSTSWQLVGTVDGTESEFQYETTENERTYCFSIVAVENNGDQQARSNTVCATAMINDPVETLVMANATVVNGEIEVSWYWNTNALIDSYTLQRASSTSNFAGLLTQTPAGPLQNLNTYTDGGINPATDAYLYQVLTTDACGVEVISNTAATILLEADGANGVNTLSWTPYTNGQGTLQGYRLFRLEAGAPIEVGFFDPNTFSATDEVDLSDPDQAQACYFLEAEATVDVGVDPNLPVKSRSNIACAAQTAKVYVPNAFSPNNDGVNDTFRPYLQFGAPLSYELRIFDRWGGLVFETQDYNNGWEGLRNSEPLNVGAYAYLLRIGQADGTIIERSGEIYLVR